MRINRDRASDSPAQEHPPSQSDATDSPAQQLPSQPGSQPTIYQCFQKSGCSPNGWNKRKWVILISLFDGTHTARDAII
eukprot:7427670-Heterocapsa_arctica.AAC.1